MKRSINFGFWILDFGIGEREPNPRSKIQNPKSSGAVVAALFLLSTMPGAGLLAACDNSTPTPTPTNSPTPTQQAVSGIPRGQAFFQRYCNVCHPGCGQG